MEISKAEFLAYTNQMVNKNTNRWDHGTLSKATGCTTEMCLAIARNYYTLCIYYDVDPNKIEDRRRARTVSEYKDRRKQWKAGTR